MTYRVRFRNTGSLHEIKPKDYEEARVLAVNLSNWNARVDIVDTDLISDNDPSDWVVIKRFEPYSEEGAQQLEATTF